MKRGSQLSSVILLWWAPPDGANATKNLGKKLLLIPAILMVLVVLSGCATTQAKHPSQVRANPTNSLSGAAALMQKRNLNKAIDKKARSENIVVGYGESMAQVEKIRKITESRGKNFDEFLREKNLTEDDFREDLRTQLIIQKLKEKITKSINAFEIKDYYAKNTEHFSQPGEFLLRKIVLRSEKEGGEVLALVKEGKDLAALAKKYSADYDTKNKGGLWGWVGIGEIPAQIAEKVRNAQVGQVISGPAGIDYWIVKVEDKRGQHQMTFKESKEFIREILAQMKVSEELAKMQESKGGRIR